MTIIKLEEIMKHRRRMKSRHVNADMCCKRQRHRVGKSLKINQLEFSLDTFWTDMKERKLSLQPDIIVECRESSGLEWFEVLLKRKAIGKSV